MVSTDSTERFVQQLTEHQNRIYGYVYSLLGDHGAASDVLQETNLVLWRKSAEFQPAKPFLPWAFAIARYQVLAHLRDTKRDRVLLDAELVESISAESQRHASDLDDRRHALRACLETLSPAGRELLQSKYFAGRSTAETAKALNRTVGSVKVALMRTRRQLLACVEKRMVASEGQP